MRKMWYATVIEHIRSFIDGSILAVSLGIAWKIPVFEIVLAIAIYVVLQANKLYMRVLADSILGASSGVNVRNMIYMLFQSATLGMGALFGAVAGIFISMRLLFPVILIYSILMVILIGLLASSRFGEMEQAG